MYATYIVETVQFSVFGVFRNFQRDLVRSYSSDFTLLDVCIVMLRKRPSFELRGSFVDNFSQFSTKQQTTLSKTWILINVLINETIKANSKT